MMKKVSMFAIISSFLLVTSAILFRIEVVDGVTVPHLNPDPLILAINTPNNTRVCPTDLEITLQFTICNDIGASVTYLLSPNNDWFLFSIDDIQNITANPNVVSSVISTVTSHHGGPTQHETTHYNVTLDLHTISEGLHKITAYAGIAIFLGDDPMFGGGIDYRPFAPLYLTIDELPNNQAPSPSHVTPTKSPISSPSLSPIDVNSNLKSPAATPTTIPDRPLSSDYWLSQTFVVALLGAVGLMVVLHVTFYFKRHRRSKVAA